MTRSSAYSSQSQFARALRAVRRARSIPQENFDLVSSRTYVSSLERGLKQPTLTKIDTLSGVLEVHPLTLLALSYVSKPTGASVKRLLDEVTREVAALGLTDF